MASDRSGRRPELVEQAGEPHELECRRRCGVGLQYVVECPVLMHARMPFPFPRYLALGSCVMDVLLEQDWGSQPCPGHDLGGCVAKDLSKVLGFSTDLVVQLVTKERRLPVHLFARAH